MVKGSIWTLAGQVLPLGISLFTTPFVIRLLGAEAYGVVVLIGLIPTYFGFADMGMGLASTKFASEAYAEGDAEKEGRVVRTAAAVAFIASLPVALALLIFSWQITGLFNVPEHLHSEASLALKIASVTFVLGFLNNIFNSPQLARLRMDLNTLVSTVPRMLGLLATPVVIYLGGGVVGAVSVLCAIAIATLAGNLIVSQKQLGTLFDTSFDKQLYRPMLKFGGALAISSIAAVLLVNLEKVVLTRVTSVETLAYYSVAFTFASAALLAAGAMMQSLIPSFSQLISVGRRDLLESLLSFVVRGTFFAILPLVIALCTIARPLLTLWAGERFAQNSTIPLYILTIGVFFHANAFIGGSLLYASGRADIVAKFFWIQLLPYVLMTLYFTSHFGAIGAAASWSFRVILESAITCYLGARSAGVKFPFRNSLSSFSIGLLCLTPPIISLFVADTWNYLPLLLFFVCMPIYLYFVWNKGFTATEKENLYLKIRRFLGHGRLEI